MHSDPHNERFYQELSDRIASLPSDEQHDAVFALFGIGLKMMEHETIVELRADLVRRFPQDDEARDMGTVLIEIIDGHLALRTLNADADSVSEDSDLGD